MSFAAASIPPFSADNTRASWSVTSQTEMRWSVTGFHVASVHSIFDLLIQNKDLTKEEREQVKKVSKDTLEKLQNEKLNIPNWKESREMKAGIKTTIYDQLLWLPEDKYTDEEVSLKSLAVYQHVYSYAYF